MQRRKSTLLIVLTLLLVAVTNTFVFTNSSQPNAGHTGAPGEFTCARAGCHAGTASATTGIVFNTVAPLNALASSYNPGQLYNITININSLPTPASSQVKDGFQITVLDSNDNMAGTLDLAPNPTTTSLTTAFNRQYVGHKTAGSVNAWNFRWTAPAAGAGPVTFYVAANRSNNLGNSAGDFIYTQSFTVPENIIVVDPCENFSASISTPGNANSFCANQSLTLTANSISGPGSPTYNWSNGGTTQAISANTAGTYTVTVTEGTCTATASLAVTSIASGEANFSVVVTNNVVVINDSSIGVVGDRTWDFGDGNQTINNSASFSYTYDSIGSYTIELSFTDACSTLQSVTQSVVIDSIPVVGIGQVALGNILSIYPNPMGSQASLYVDGFDGATFQFTLVDLSGKAVRSQQGQGGNPIVIDRDGLPSGMYFYSITLQGQTAQGKLLID
jgi:hypothetical protein